MTRVFFGLVLLAIATPAAAQGAPGTAISGTVQDQQCEPTLTTRQPRDLPQMVEALGRHVRLLDAYTVKARTDSDYLGEVALKLRLLLLDSRKRKALLLRVGEAYQADFGVLAQTDSAPTSCDLLDLPVTDVGGATLSLRAFIRGWREQVRNIPEDWTYDQVLLRGASNLRVDEVCLAKSNLDQIASRVVTVARALLRHVEMVERRL